MAKKGTEVIVNIKGDTKDYDKASKNVKNDAKELGNSFEDVGNKIKNAFNSVALVGWIKSIKQATEMMINYSQAQTEYIENLNLLNVAYGDVNNSGKNLINTMSNIIGLDQSNLTKTLASYRQISDALGIANENANLLSENLLKMTQDVSSLYNLDFAKASEKLTSAITGLYKRLARVKPIELLEHLIKGNQQPSLI